MPKIVNHEDRRREVIEATWRIIAAGGLANATTREIAREAGYSNGVLAHYFTDKSEILSSTLVAAHRGVRSRTDEMIADHTGLSALRILMLESLPLDEQRILEAQIEVSFWGQALGNPELIEIQNREVDGFRERLRRCLGEASRAGEIRAEVDTEGIVDELHVLMDGLSVQAVFYPAVATNDTQIGLLDALLDRIRAKPVDEPGNNAARTASRANRAPIRVADRTTA